MEIISKMISENYYKYQTTIMNWKLSYTGIPLAGTGSYEWLNMSHYGEIIDRTLHLARS